MIDYDKLKLAEKLILNSTNYANLEIQILNNGRYGFSLMTHETSREFFKDLDELIEKLQELTKPQSRYKIGSTWWFLDGPDFEQYPKPRSLLITEENHGWYRYDDEWFPSKQDLIKSQINYWDNLLSEELEQHVSDYCYPDQFHKPVKYSRPISCRNKSILSTQNEDMLMPSTCNHDGHINCNKCNAEWTTGFVVVDESLWG